MRIDELLEALPGSAEVGRVGRFLGKVGLGGQAAAAEKAFTAKANKAYNIWITQVPKLRLGGIDVNDQQIYAVYFGRWMAPNLKVDVTDPIIKKAVAELRVAPTVDKKFMIALITKMMGQLRAKQIKTKPTPPGTPPAPPGTPPAPPPTGTQATTGLDTYEWSGTEWKNTTTGQVATPAVAAALLAQLRGTNP